MLAVGIVLKGRRPYLAIEAAGEARAHTVSPAPRRSYGANLLRRRGTPPRMIPASVRMLMMLSDMPTARLAITCCHHGDDDHRRCKDGQRQKPSHMSPHACLPWLTSRSAVARLPIRIKIERRRPYLAIEAAAGRAEFGSGVACGRRGTEFLRREGVAEAMAGSVALMASLPADRLALRRREHGLSQHGRPTNSQRQESHRGWTHACLPRIPDLPGVQFAPARRVCRVNSSLLAPRAASQP
jgi:hypothetical protein